MNNQILFLVGMPRSGTKLLRNMLNGHPAVAIFPIETHFIPFFDQEFSAYGNITIRSNFSKFFSDIQRTNFFVRMVSRDISIAESDWFDNLQGAEYSDVLDALFRCYAEMTGCQIVGDKTPAYMTQAPLLLTLFPNAQFIHIVRDPRDYVISIRKAWNQNMSRAAQRWKQSIRKFHTDLNSKNVSFCEVKYEDLIANPQQCLEQACTYLGIDFSENMLVLDEPAENLGDAKGALNIVQDNFNKWETQLSCREVRTVESISGALMEELGYTVSQCAGDRDVSAFLMGLARFQDSWNRFKFTLREERSLMGALTRMRRIVRFRVPGG